MIWTCLSLLVAVVSIRAYRNTFDLTTQSVSVAIKPSKRFRDTNTWQPLTILHLSDLHMENLSVEAERIVRDFHGQPIDLIAITGDLLDRQKNIPKAVAYVETVMKLRPALGTFVVFGNHDYVLPPNKLAQLKCELERLGCHVLRNQSVTLKHNGQTLHVIGVDDYATRRSDLAKAYKNVTDEGVRLVLTHDPNIVLRMADYDYDYLLAGHFHGGQIHWPKPFHLIKMGKLPKMNMVKGLHYYDNRPFYISEGLGQTGVNVRLRSRPEITLHTLTITEALQPKQPVTEQHPVAEAAPTLAWE
jgi:predicted MPP superfamily phosphohydrolase